MRVDAEFAGVIVAVGFLVMGAVGLDFGNGSSWEPWRLVPQSLCCCVSNEIKEGIALAATDEKASYCG
jgi:hypothetical protein